MTTEDQTIAARRGNTWLSDLELQAHLATLLRLENIGVFLGAGASLDPLGGKTMASIWEEYQEENSVLASWLSEEGFIQDESDVDVELLLDSLEIALIEARRRGDDYGRLSTARRSLQRSVISAALLNRNWWTDAGNIGLQAKELSGHRLLLLQLVSSRMPGQAAPWIFTTNYDLAVEWAGETLGIYIANGFSGLHRRSFTPTNFDLGYRNVLARGEARFGTYNIYLAKLHGSLSWYLEDGQLLEGACGHLWPALEEFLSGRTNEGPGVLVYPSGAKHLETASFELGELVRRFSEFVARPQSGLIISGYSFSDQHLNRVLMASLQNPTFHLVVYFPGLRRSGNKWEFQEQNEFLRKLAELQSPQVTIVGGGETAHFTSFVEHIPDPVIYDEQAREDRATLRELRRSPPEELETEPADSPAPNSGASLEDDEGIPF